jgi:K+/H+ antiporter YhaU regulatory subunit KhtT
MDLRIREQRLPGIGNRYDLPLDRRWHLMIVVGRDGRCQVGVIDGDADEPDRVVSLSREQAVAVAALLAGARFTIDTSEDERVATDEITVETLEVRHASPAVGQVVDDMSFPADSDATVLAVIRDKPAELVEEQPVDPLRAGDRVVISARRDRLGDIARQLVG